MVSGFEEALCGGESVVEEGVVGEVAHGEVVDLVDRAGGFRAVPVDAMDGEFADEHGFSLIDALAIPSGAEARCVSLRIRRG